MAATAAANGGTTAAEIAALRAYMDRQVAEQDSSASAKAPPSKTDTSADYYSCIEAISFLAIFVIGITALAGSFSGHETMILGWTVAGTAVVLGVMSTMALYSGNQVIGGIFFAAMFVLFGVLGATGIFDATQLGWSIVGTGITTVGTIVGLLCCATSCHNIYSQIVAPAS